jgi:sugar phosphate isomerase/epimerase
MMYPGLVSITYRQYSPEQLIALCKNNSLTAIEWGGDVHVPHGDLDTAARVAKMTRDAALSMPSYGTYYKAGAYGDNYRAEFDKVLQTAVALDAPALRLWAGSKNSEDVTPDERESLIRELRGCADMAAEYGKIITFERHNGTLTNRAASALAMIEEIGRKNVRTHWQPSQFLTHEENCEGLSLLLPYIDCVHVFAWEGKNSQRFTLAAHRDRWTDYLSILRDATQDIYLMMEFTPTNDPAEFQTEAETLLSWL